MIPFNKKYPKTIALSILFLIFSFSCSAFSATASNLNQEIKIGTISGPETQLMEVAKEVAQKEYGITIKIIEFSDYTIPNTALVDGSIDANMFQHQPYLDSVLKIKHYPLVAIAKVFIYPMAIYSKKWKNIANIPQHGIIAVPNDPSNEARALLLLQQAKLLTLRTADPLRANLFDVNSNTQELHIKEIDAAQLPRVLQDVDAAVINTNYAIPAGLTPENSIFHENADSPYANLLVVRENDKNDPRFKKVIAALHSQAVIDKAKVLFNGGAIQAW